MNGRGCLLATFIVVCAVAVFAVVVLSLRDLG